MSLKCPETERIEYETSNKERTRLRRFSDTLKLNNQSSYRSEASTTSSLSNGDIVLAEENTLQRRSAVKFQPNSNAALTGNEMVKGGLYGGYLSNHI